MVMSALKQKATPAQDQFRGWSELVDPYRRQAHSLSGSSRTFGAEQLGAFAGAFERLAVAGMFEEEELRYEEVASAMEAASGGLTATFGTRA